MLLLLDPYCLVPLPCWYTAALLLLYYTMTLLLCLDAASNNYCACLSRLGTFYSVPQVYPVSTVIVCWPYTLGLRSGTQRPLSDAQCYQSLCCIAPTLVGSRYCCCCNVHFSGVIICAVLMQAALQLGLPLAG